MIYSTKLDFFFKYQQGVSTKHDIYNMIQPLKTQNDCTKAPKQKTLSTGKQNS